MTQKENKEIERCDLFATIVGVTRGTIDKHVRMVVFSYDYPKQDMVIRYYYDRPTIQEDLEMVDIVCTELVAQYPWTLNYVIPEVLYSKEPISALSTLDGVVFERKEDERFQIEENDRKPSESMNYFESYRETISIVKVAEDNIAIAEAIHTQKDKDIEITSPVNQLMVYMENNAIHQAISSIHNLLFLTREDLQLLKMMYLKQEYDNKRFDEKIYRKYKKYYMDNYPYIEPESQEYLGDNLQNCSGMYYQSGDFENDIQTLVDRWNRSGLNGEMGAFYAFKNITDEMLKTISNNFDMTHILSDKGMKDLKEITSDLSKYLRFSGNFQAHFFKLEDEVNGLVNYMNEKEQERKKQ